MSLNNLRTSPVFKTAMWMSAVSDSRKFTYPLKKKIDKIRNKHCLCPRREGVSLQGECDVFRSEECMAVIVVEHDHMSECTPALLLLKHGCRKFYQVT